MPGTETRVKERFQNMLPSGILLKDPIRENWTDNSGDAQRLWLFHAEDSRVGSPLDRIVRFIRLEGVAWAEKYRERLKKLMSCPVPYTARPLHAGFSDDGSVGWLISDRRGKPLETTTFLHGDGLPENSVLVLLRHMLTALASLHEAGMKHGNVSPENIVLDPSDGQHQIAWLSGVSTGELAAWTRNEQMPDGSGDYVPPKYDGRPSEQADLYAVGLVACEMLLGRNGSPHGFPAAAKNNDVRPHVKELLKQNGRSLSRKTRKIVFKHLLDPDAQHAVTAREILAQVEAALSPKRPWLWATAAVVLILATLGMFRFVGNYRESALFDLLREIEHMQQQMQNVEDSVGRDVASKLNEVDLRTRRDSEMLQELAAGLIDHRKVIEIHENTEVLPLELAKTQWKDVFRNGGLAAVEKWLNDEKNAELRARGQKRKKQVDRLAMESSTWRPCDKTMRDAFERVAQNPWNAEAASVFDQRLKLLNDMRKRWSDWAADRELEPDQLEKNIARESDQGRKILNAWYEDLKKFKPQLRLISGKGPEGYGKWRVVGVHTSADGRVYPEKDSPYEWSSETAHSYKTTSSDIRDIAFSWKPGDLIKIRMWGARSMLTGNRPDIIQPPDGVFDGPLAIWWAANAANASSKNGFSLSYEIIDAKTGAACPGPPKFLKVTTSSRLGL